MTRNGYTCQYWSVQYPHAHTCTHAYFPNLDFDLNKCRTCGYGSDTIWCYTTNSSVRWDYCDPVYQNPANALLYSG